MRRATVAVLAAAAAAAGPAGAAANPSRPLRLIVPYVPGGATDTLSRLVAPHLSEALGQPVLVDNRPGGNSALGTEIVARASPDGTTIGMIDAAFVTNPSLVPKLPYDTLRDFSPIVFVATSPLVLLVHPSSPATSVRDLVALATKAPGKLTFGSAGTGTGVHLAAEQLRIAAGIDVVHVPYKGGGQAVAELLGNQISMAFAALAVGRAQAGKLRALASTAATRSAVLPDVPTMAEAGFPQVDAVTINGLVGPARMPRELVGRMNVAVTRALATPELRSRLTELGFEIRGGTPEDFATWIRAEVAKWARIVKLAGIQAD